MGSLGSGVEESKEKGSGSEIPAETAQDDDVLTTKVPALDLEELLMSADRLEVGM